MLLWFISLLLGATLAIGTYTLRERSGLRRLAPLAALRTIAFTILFALLLGAPVGAVREPRPVVALDVSGSWLRGGDTARWIRARDHAASLAIDSLVLFGDSARAGMQPPMPTDPASRVRPLVERVLGSGRPIVLITDGELDDPGAVAELPGGSRMEIPDAEERVDLAAISLEAPNSVVSGDTIEVRATVRAAAPGVASGRLALLLGDRELVALALDSIPGHGERTVALRTPVIAGMGPSVLSVVVSADGDREARNDTVSVPLDVARAAGAVFVSTAPDQDARFAIPVLRGSVALPTRAYFRVAPGSWRREGTLASVSEAEVRQALRDAPLAVIHGDTALFGPPRSATRGALALLAPPRTGGGEWYAVGAPPSPVSGALAGIPWDTLPPLDVAAALLAGDWTALVTARGRRFERRPAIAGFEVGRRVVVVGASGFWRWRFRGGEAADAYTTLWGSIFDWLTGERADVRAAVPADGVLRAGEPVSWRRGARGDSVVVALLRRRGDPERVDSVTVRFAGGTSVTQTSPLPAGVYEATVPGGTALVVVNVSRELLPRQRTVQAGPVGSITAAGSSPRLREQGWVYLLVVLALCAEWLLRRRTGLR